MYWFASQLLPASLLKSGLAGSLEKMIQYFPSVGLLLEILLVSFDHLALWLWRQPVASLMDVIFLAPVTGAFHLDGLSDFKEKLKLSAFWGMIIPVVMSGLLGWSVICLNVGFVAITGAILWYYNRRMRCITDDMLGAMTEITESAPFLLMSIGGVARLSV